MGSLIIGTSLDMKKTPTTSKQSIRYINKIKDVKLENIFMHCMRSSRNTHEKGVVLQQSTHSDAHTKL